MFPLSFTERVSVPVMNALTYAHKSGCEVRLYYGDTDTGRCYVQEHSDIGTLGHTAGGAPAINFSAVPLHAIVAIQRVDNGEYIYKHPKHYLPELEVVAVNNGYEVRDEYGQTYIRYKGKAPATRWLRYITGQNVRR